MQNTKAKIMIYILIIVVVQNFVFAESKIEKIDQFINHYAEKGFLNGTVLIAENGQIIYQKAYGIANREWNVPHQTDGIFQIYSMSKQFTSLIMLQLAQEGKVNLTDPITKYLDYYRKDTGDEIKIHHLLNHSHGIAIPDWNSIPTSLEIPLDEFVKTHLSGDLMFEPGSKFNYGTVGRGHVIAAAVIEKVTGKSFETVLKERILEPLGMDETGIFNSHEILPKYVGSYRKNADLITKRIIRNSSQKMGASSMYSCLKDLFIWERALYSDNLLSDAFKEKMFSPHVPTSGGMHYGYGVRIASISVSDTEKKLVWHGGGGVSLICRAIEDEHTVIFLNNITTDLSLYLASMEILKILYDQPLELVKIHIYDLLRQVIENQGIEKAIAHYHNLKSDLPTYYVFDENELNILGNYFMYYKQYADAIQIFKLNVSEYPNSDKVYYILGEAYMKNGQNKHAIKNYEKSLELNPDNKKAKEKLNELKKNEDL